MSTINIAVIGAGFGRHHINGIINQPDRFRLGMVCDQNAERITDAFETLKLARPATCRIGRDYQEALNDPDIQAVVVSLPHHLHEVVCVKAAQAHKHILVDKPIARTLAEADHIIQAAEQNHVTLMVAFNLRFEPTFRKLHDVVSSGEIGQPLYAMTRHYQCFNAPADSNWHSKTSVGGGCVMGSGVHNLDLMRWFFGEPEEVFAYGTHDPQRLEAEAAAAISFRYTSGLVVNFCCNWVCSGAVPSPCFDDWEVFGSAGDIVNRLNTGFRIGHDFGKQSAEVTCDNVTPYENLWEHFATAMTTGSLPLTHGRDARATLALVLNVYESMKTGRPVKCDHALG